jgi:hypothetical protein
MVFRLPNVRHPLMEILLSMQVLFALVDQEEILESKEYIMKQIVHGLLTMIFMMNQDLLLILIAVLFLHLFIHFKMKHIW